MHNITDHGQCIHGNFHANYIHLYAPNIYCPRLQQQQWQQKGNLAGLRGMMWSRLSLCPVDRQSMMATLQATTLQTVFAPYGHIAASAALKTNFPKVWTSSARRRSVALLGFGLGSTTGSAVCSWTRAKESASAATAPRTCKTVWGVARHERRQ